MVRFKTRDNIFTQYELNTLLTDGSGNYQAYTSIDKATFNFLPATNAYANPNDPNNYSAKKTYWHTIYRESTARRKDFKW